MAGDVAQNQSLSLSWCCTLLAVIVSGLAPAPAVAETVGTNQESGREFAGGPYCGVYSVYAALRTLGVELRFEDLLKHEYIGSYDGSTARELKRAVEDFGAHAQVIEGLRGACLRGSSSPIILHVRRPGLKTSFAHWVLFLGVQDGLARVVDPPATVQLMPFAELLAVWDGTGIVVSRETQSVSRLLAVAWIDQGTLLLLVVAVLGLIRIGSTRGSPVRSIRQLPPSCLGKEASVVTQHHLAPTATPAASGYANSRLLWRDGLLRLGGRFAALTLVAVGIAITCHLSMPDGFFANGVAVALAAGRHLEPEFRTVSVNDVDALLNAEDVAFLDARYPRDFRSNHLPGAINLPVYAGPGSRTAILDKLSTKTRIIVYCQSRDCPWAKSLASDIVLRGYPDVRLFPGGINEWEQHRQSIDRP